MVEYPVHQTLGLPALLRVGPTSRLTQTKLIFTQTSVRAGGVKPFNRLPHSESDWMAFFWSSKNILVVRNSKNKKRPPHNGRLLPCYMEITFFFSIKRLFGSTFFFCKRRLKGWCRHPSPMTEVHQHFIWLLMNSCAVIHTTPPRAHSRWSTLNLMGGVKTISKVKFL